MGLFDILFGQSNSSDRKTAPPQRSTTLDERLQEAGFGIQRMDGCNTCNFCDYYNRETVGCNRLDVLFWDDFECSDYRCRYLNTSEFDGIIGEAVEILKSEDE